MRTGESGYFRIRWRKCLSPNNKPIWLHNVSGQQSKFPATISLYGACSEDIVVQRSLGVSPDTIRYVWTGEFDLNTLRVDGEIFESEKKKMRIQKYLETCGRGLKLPVFTCFHLFSHFTFHSFLRLKMLCFSAIALLLFHWCVYTMKTFQLFKLKIFATS